MHEHHQESVPLIGALFVAEGLITMGQLEECLLIQAFHQPNIPIGQILVGRGYISDEECDRILDMQHEFRSSIFDAFEVCIG